MEIDLCFTNWREPALSPAPFPLLSITEIKQRLAIKSSCHRFCHPSFLSHQKKWCVSAVARMDPSPRVRLVLVPIIVSHKILSLIIYNKGQLASLCKVEFTFVLRHGMLFLLL